jgi:hypothetical protein
VLAVLAVPASASAQEAPDASCPGPQDGGTANASGGNGRYAQTFTALGSGTLTRAQASISKGGISADWVMEMHAVDGSGTPTNEVLASATIPDATVPAGDSTLTATFANPAPVTAGQAYALVVTRPGSNSLGIGVRFGTVCPGSLYSSSSQVAPFTMSSVDLIFAVFVTPPPDLSPPETTITRGPKDKTKKRKATFEFSSSEPGSSFNCQVDKGPLTVCSSPFTVKVKRGKHTFRVQALDAAGNVDGSPASDDWKVKKKRKH